MASTSQLKANRANAKHSTGPKSASGKLKSRYNALKHGLSAQQIVIGEEEPTEFDALLNALIEDCAPVSALELELVEQLASIIWRIRRIPRLEVAIIEYHRAEISKMQPDQSYDGIRRAELAKKALRYLPKNSVLTEAEPECLQKKEIKKKPISRQLGAALVRDVQNGDMLSKLSRYETSLMNGLVKTINTLFLIQSRRAEDVQVINGISI